MARRRNNYYAYWVTSETKSRRRRLSNDAECIQNLKKKIVETENEGQLGYQWDDTRNGNRVNWSTYYMQGCIGDGRVGRRNDCCLPDPRGLTGRQSLHTPRQTVKQTNKIRKTCYQAVCHMAQLETQNFRGERTCFQLAQTSRGIRDSSRSLMVGVHWQVERGEVMLVHRCAWVGSHKARLPNNESTIPPLVKSFHGRVMARKLKEQERTGHRWVPRTSGAGSLGLN